MYLSTFNDPIGVPISKKDLLVIMTKALLKLLVDTRLVDKLYQHHDQGLCRQSVANYITHNIYTPPRSSSGKVGYYDLAASTHNHYSFNIFNKQRKAPLFPATHLPVL